MLLQHLAHRRLVHGRLTYGRLVQRVPSAALAPRTHATLAAKLKDPSLLLPYGYINNEPVKSADSGKTFAVYDPAYAREIAALPEMGASETRRAVAAATAAFSQYRQTTAKERAQMLRRWFNLVLENRADLAALTTAESGKPLAESLGEVDYGASFIEWFSEQARSVTGSVVPSPVRGRRLLVAKEPVGVAGIITPWNFPIAMITRKVAAALAAGCTTVIKPASETPLSAVALAALAARAGFPAGAINIVTASRDTSPLVGDEICANPDVRKLSFTGSTAVGKRLYAQCAPTVKRISLELGGNAPFIVFDDADLDAAVAGCIGSKFRNTGQTCVCVNRIYVHEKVYDAFSEKLASAVRALKQGHGFDPLHALGPVISGAALEKVHAHVEDAVARGAKIVCGGHRTLEAHGGHFYAGTVLTNVPPNARIAHEETFGPVAALFSFAGEDEVVQLANSTPFGLASYVYTRDPSRMFRMADRLEAGMVGVNEGLISAVEGPFGGVKESGIGREGSHVGIDEYLNIKYVCLGGL